jgi:predicted secreted protein
MYKIILFDSTNYVMMAESILKDENVKMRVVPVPRDLSASCGVSIRIMAEDEPKVLEIFSKMGVTYKAIHNI